MASSLDLKSLREKRRHVYLLVYTSTDAEEKLYHCGGGLDLGLSEQGMDQARKCARRFKKNPLKIKKIFVSPELRAVQMADFLHDEIHGKIQLLRGFADQNLGEREGEKCDDANPADLVMEAPPRGEARFSFQARIRSAFETLLHEELVCLLVTHARVAAEILTMMGIEHKSIERGLMYAIDLPAEQGAARLREV